VVFDSTNEGVVISDSRNRIVNVNNAFCRITGYTHEEVVGQKATLLKSAGMMNCSTEMWEAFCPLLAPGQGESGRRTRMGNLSPVADDQCGKRAQKWELTHLLRSSRYIGAQAVAQEIDFSWPPRSTDAPAQPLTAGRATDQRAWCGQSAANSGLGLIFIAWTLQDRQRTAWAQTAGDELLRCGCERMLACVARKDTLARPGW